VRKQEKVWNVVLSGYPCSGKTRVAKRLVGETQSFVRLGADDMRRMMFDETYPSRNEDLVFETLMAARDSILEDGKSVVVDTSAPNNRIRAMLLSTRVKNVKPVLVMVESNRKILASRNEAEGRWRTVEQWDRYWEAPHVKAQIIKIKNNSTKEFETGYHALSKKLGFGL